MLGNAAIQPKTLEDFQRLKTQGGDVAQALRDAVTAQRIDPKKALEIARDTDLGLDPGTVQQFVGYAQQTNHHVTKTKPLHGTAVAQQLDNSRLTVSLADPGAAAAQVGFKTANSIHDASDVLRGFKQRKGQHLSVYLESNVTDPAQAARIALSLIGQLKSDPKLAEIGAKPKPQQLALLQFNRIFIGAGAGVDREMRAILTEDRPKLKAVVDVTGAEPTVKVYKV